MAVVCMSMIAPPSASAQPSCGPDQADALRLALAQLPFEPLTGAKWDSTPVDSNYDACAELSTILVTTEGGTGSSPVQALLFHRGEYLGTGTSKAYGFTSLDAAASTGDTVVLTYKVPGECNACMPAAVHSARYQWNGDRAVMLDPPPPSA
ncbi:LppP/LprE family lipoprotein [Mycolicibacterium sp. ND9-15]|uniref:LppP/LprE family lipoprotein n=1 Tax=Mycolicibacterium sp. ND9-15 TaxID=3042320 RepID=UPI002DDAFDD8|nr:LppP/LprE family lipoprotein [Mycolicibacterium sp. ND9-15]WSE57707.1 LppP/LprE family lipoprotein [Mycolicibacterium sp. ND9-15]